MTQNRADQDCLNAVIAPLVERFGIIRIVVALHAVANKKAPINKHNDYNEVVGLLEELEYNLQGLKIPALEGVSLKLPES